jgi:transposase
MGKANFSDDFKRDAVHQITERGYPVAEVSKRLGVSPHSLYAWKKKFEQPLAVEAQEPAVDRRPSAGSPSAAAATRSRPATRRRWRS